MICSFCFNIKNKLLLPIFLLLQKIEALYFIGLETLHFTLDLKKSKNEIRVVDFENNINIIYVYIYVYKYNILSVDIGWFKKFRKQ